MSFTTWRARRPSLGSKSKDMPKTERLSQRENARPRRNRPLVLEQLEDRTVPSANNLAIVGDQGTGQNDLLTIHDSPSGLHYTLNGEDHDYASGVYTSITVDLGSGYNEIDVQATSVPLAINNSTDGADFVYMTDHGSLANINGPVDVRHAGSGYTSMYVEDGSDPDTKSNVILDDGALTGLAPAPITWFAAPNASTAGGVTELVVDCGSGGNTLTVNNTSLFYHYTILAAGSGPNQINVRGTTGELSLHSTYGGHNDVTLGNPSAALGSTLANFNGPVYFDYDQSYTNLVVDDSGDSIGRNVTFDYDGNLEKMSGLSPAPIYFIAGSPTISGTGVRSVNVYGGQGDDTFNLARALPIVTIDGGRGTNTLAYSAFTSGVSVNLLADTATGLAGIGRIQNAIGGAGNDLLVGDGAANILDGGAGDDVVIGGDGDDTLFGGSGRDLLIGGLGADWINGMSGDDILIGGYTDFDTQIDSRRGISHRIDLPALDAIMKEWTRTDLDGLGALQSYKTRVEHLSSGRGGLNGSVVLKVNGQNDDVHRKDKMVDTLVGGDGFDWFFANKKDEVVDRLPQEKLS
jgi:Ca2+-binding RTX toxin-like protein